MMHVFHNTEVMPPRPHAANLDEYDTATLSVREEADSTLEEHEMLLNHPDKECVRCWAVIVVACCAIAAVFVGVAR